MKVVVAAVLLGVGEVLGHSHVVSADQGARMIERTARRQPFAAVVRVGKDLVV
jgi:hypothetical protein